MIRASCKSLNGAISKIVFALILSSQVLYFASSAPGAEIYLNDQAATFYKFLIKQEPIIENIDLEKYSKELAIDYKRYGDYKRMPQSLENDHHFIVELNTMFASKKIREGLIEVVEGENKYRIITPDGDVVGTFITFWGRALRKPSERGYIRFRIREQLIDLVDKFGEPQPYQIGTTFKGLKQIMKNENPFARLAVQWHRRNCIIKYAREDRINGLYVLLLSDRHETFLYTFPINGGGDLAETVFEAKNGGLIWNEATQRYDLKELNLGRA